MVIDYDRVSVSRHEGKTNFFSAKTTQRVSRSVDAPAASFSRCSSFKSPVLLLHPTAQPSPLPLPPLCHGRNLPAMASSVLGKRARSSDTSGNYLNTPESLSGFELTTDLLV